jgi:hypothetical protein
MDGYGIFIKIILNLIKKDEYPKRCTQAFWAEERANIPLI